jgi:hypothetical protein
MNLPQLQDGDYKIKLSYSLDDGQNYNHQVMDFSGQELYVKMQVRDGIAYLRDCFLSNSYGLESITVSSGVTVNEPFTVDAKLSYEVWGSQNGPLGNVYVSMLKDGNEVATSEMCEVSLSPNTEKSYQMQLTAPSEWGLYDLVTKSLMESLTGDILQVVPFLPIAPMILALYLGIGIVIGVFGGVNAIRNYLKV